MIIDQQKIENTDSCGFFFILGRPRSGTTLLMSMLDANPHTLIPVECPVIKNLYPVYGKKTSWSKADLEKFYTDLLQQSFYDRYKFTDLNFDFEGIRQSLLMMEGSYSYGDLIRVVYTHYTSVFPKSEIKLLGDKNPDSSNFIDTYIRIFPDAKFIHITRDYRDHIQSMLNAGFGIPNIAMLAYRWKLNYIRLEKARVKQPDRFLKLRYEDLVTDPEKKLTEICDFLQTDFYPLMVHYEEHIAGGKLYPGKLTEEYQKSLLTGLNPAKLYNWKKNMPERDVETADMVVGKYAEMAGYERIYKSRNFMYLFYMFPVWLRKTAMVVIKPFLLLFPNRIRVKLRYQKSVFTSRDV